MAGTDIQWWYGETLKQCQPLLVEEYSIRPSVEELTWTMYSEEHITSRQRQDIHETNLTSEKMERLLAILIGKSDAASYECLVRVLNDEGLYNITDVLNTTMETVKTQTHWHYGVTLKQCISYLVGEYTIPSCVADLVDVMHMDGHITYRERQDISQVAITTKQMEQLLGILISKSNAASFRCLIRELNDNNRSDIVDVINNHMEKVKMLSKPPEETILEMVERIKLNPMDVPPSEMLRCFTIMAERLTQAGTQDGGATSTGQRHAATLSTKDDKTQDEAFNRLMQAIESGDTDEVKRLLDQHPTCINRTNGNGETPLMSASRHNNLNTVIELLKSDVIDINMRDVNGRTALMYGVLGGGCDVITLLLNTDHVDVNIRDNNGLKYHWYIFGTDVVQYLAILPKLLAKAKDAVKIFAIYEIYFIQYFDKIKELQKKIDTLENIPNVVKCLLANRKVNHTHVLMSCLAIGTPDLVLTVLESPKCVIDMEGITDYAYAIVSSVNPRIVEFLIAQSMIDLDRLTTVEMDTLVESVIRYNCPKLCARMTKLIQALPVNEALRTVLTFQAIPVDVWFTVFDKQLYYTWLTDNAGNSVAHLLCKYCTHEAVAEVIQWPEVDFTRRNYHGQTCYMLSLLNCDTNVAKLLFDSENVKVGVNDKDNFQTSTLDYACQSGNIEAVKSLIASPMVDVNAQNIDGKTTVMNVCVEYFLFSILSMSNFQDAETELAKAYLKMNRMPSLISKNNTEIITILLDSDKIDLNLKTTFGVSILAFACFGGNATAVSKLIEKGVNVNDTRNHSITALMDASSYGTCEIVSLLLRAKANINAVNDHGHTALTLACLVENTEVVPVLLRENANVNIAVASLGYTPLHYACLAKNMVILKLLLAAKADVHKATHKGNTSLHLAVGSESDISDKDIMVRITAEDRAFLLSKQVPNPDIVRVLLQSKADVNATTHDEVTPLMSACERESVEIVRILVTAGSDLNKTDSRGNTALTISCQPGKEAVLKELLSAKNLEINALNQRGFSALTEACFANQPKTVALLLEHNADRNLIIYSNPLLKMVEEKGYTEIADMLKNMP